MDREIGYMEQRTVGARAFAHRAPPGRPGIQAGTDSVCSHRGMPVLEAAPSLIVLP
jgi:hypothetical protein